MTKEEQQRVHQVRNRWGEVEEWVECTPEEWERAAKEERLALGLGGLHRFEPAQVRRAQHGFTMPLWDVLSANDGWFVLKVPAINALEAVPERMSGLKPHQLEMRMGKQAGAMWFVSRSGEPEHVFSVRERW